MTQIQKMSLMSCDGTHTHKVDVSGGGELFLQRPPALGLWETLCVWAGARLCCFRGRSWLQGPPALGLWETLCVWTGARLCCSRGRSWLQRPPALGLWETLCVWTGARLCCSRGRSWLQGPACCQRSRKSRLGDGFLGNGSWDEVISVWRRNVRHRAKKREEGKYGQKWLRLKSFYNRGKMLNNH